MNNICILGLPRSGSTYLTWLIKQGQDLEVVSEPFYGALYEHEHTPQHVMRQLQAQAERGILLKEIHLFYPLLEHIRDDYTKLLADKFYTIKLIRKDMFEQVLSHAIARQTNQWNISTSYKPPTKIVKINPEEFELLYNRTRKYNQQLLTYQPYDDIIYYEDLISANFKRDYISLPDVLSDDKPNKLPAKRLQVLNYNQLKQIAEKIEKN